jgi:hypothetical protein
MTIITASRRQRQEHQEFEASLCYILKTLSIKKKKTKQKEKERKEKSRCQ